MLCVWGFGSFIPVPLVGRGNPRAMVGLWRESGSGDEIICNKDMIHEMLDVKEEQAHLNGEKPDVDVVPGETAQHPHLATLDVQTEVVHL